MDESRECRAGGDGSILRGDEARGRDKAEEQVEV